METTRMSGASSSGATTPAPTAAAILGKDDFLKLFVTQLQHQDPMDPMKDQDFMGQMASFSTLEQVSNLANANARMAESLGLAQSIGLIGRTVTFKAGEGEPITGVVEKVSMEGGRSVLTVSGHEGVDPASITQVS